ncbi:MAG: hypothetical protein AB8G22_02410 [Saprospiraceae bacterium]
MQYNFIGIDYGSKLAGTTVIAHYQSDTKPPILLQSEKKRDADKFILEFVKKERPDYIFLDAPLSLPGIYTNLPNCESYFYRAGDAELRAMSPMFLGGLTARAMQLKAQLEPLGATVLEIYPSQLAKVLGLKELNYKKQVEYLAPVLEKLATETPFPLPANIKNWHQVDALLALFSGYRYLTQQHLSYGIVAEGQIIV